MMVAGVRRTDGLAAAWVKGVEGVEKEGNLVVWEGKSLREEGEKKGMD